MRPRARSAHFSWGVTLIGLLLISVNPLVVFCIPMPDTARYAVSAILGCPAMGIGFVLLGAAGHYLHGKTSRARDRPSAGGQLAVAGHAAYEQSLADRGNHGGADHRPGSVRRHANLGLFHARTVTCPAIGCPTWWSA